MWVIADFDRYNWLTRRNIGKSKTPGLFDKAASMYGLNCGRLQFAEIGNIGISVLRVSDSTPIDFRVNNFLTRRVDMK